MKRMLWWKLAPTISMVCAAGLKNHADELTVIKEVFDLAGIAA
jgi:hypothetical protein